MCKASKQLKKLVGRTFQSVRRALLRHDDRLESRSHSQAAFFNRLLGIGRLGTR